MTSVPTAYLPNTLTSSRPRAMPLGADAGIRQPTNAATTLRNVPVCLVYSAALAPRSAGENGGHRTEWARPTACGGRRRRARCRSPTFDKVELCCRRQCGGVRSCVLIATVVPHRLGANRTHPPSQRGAHCGHHARTSTDVTPAPPANPARTALGIPTLNSRCRRIVDSPSIKCVRMAACGWHAGLTSTNYGWNPVTLSSHCQLTDTAGRNSAAQSSTRTAKRGREHSRRADVDDTDGEGALRSLPSRPSHTPSRFGPAASKNAHSSHWPGRPAGADQLLRHVATSRGINWVSGQESSGNICSGLSGRSPNTAAMCTDVESFRLRTVEAQGRCER